MRETQEGARSEAGPAIGAAIRSFRRERNWSIEALAVRAGLSYQYLCEIETGKRNFTIDVLERAARALEMPLLRLVSAALAPAAPPGAPPTEAPAKRPAIRWPRAA